MYNTFAYIHSPWYNAFCTIPFIIFIFGSSVFLQDNRQLHASSTYYHDDDNNKEQYDQAKANLTRIILADR